MLLNVTLNPGRDGNLPADIFNTLRSLDRRVNRVHMANPVAGNKGISRHRVFQALT
jgi:hypothetical protein